MVLVRRYKILDARIVAANGDEKARIDVIDATITMDSTWSPYAQISLTCARPSAGVLAAIDPRQGQRLLFTHWQQNSDGQVVQRSFVLGLRARTVNWKTGQMTLTAASHEAIAQDYVGTGYAQNPAPAGYLIAIGWQYLNLDVIQENGAPAPYIDDDGADWDPGTTAWDWMSQTAEAAGGWTYCDETGQPHYAAPTWAADTDRHDLADPITDVSDTVSRDNDWANHVTVAYTKNDPVEYVRSGAVVAGSRGMFVSRDRKKPSGNAATKIRAAAMRRGRTLTVTALADISCRPNHRYRVAYLGVQDFTGLVQNVSFNHPSGLMTLLLNISEP